MQRAILKNSLWMMTEKVVSIFGLIFVTSFVAKYVGPGIYGNIALSLAIFQIVQIVSQFGSDVIIFKRVAVNLNSGVNLIRATFLLRLSVYIIVSLPVLIYFYLDGTDGYAFIAAAFIACLFQSLDVYSIYYDACLKSMVNVFVNLFGLVLSLVVRGGVPLFELNPLWLAVPMVLASLIPFAIRSFYFKRSESLSVLTPRFTRKYRKYLISAGLSFALSSISVALYTRMSVFTLGFISGHSAVAIYSVASTLATSWSFVIYSFITSTLPSIFAEKDVEAAQEKVAKLTWLVVGISSVVITGAFLLSRLFLQYFYGESYISAYYPLLILCFSTLVSSLGAISARYIAKYSGYKYLSVKTIIVAVFSLAVNYYMIVSYGILGAAFSTLLIELMSLTIFNYFFKNFIILKLHVNSLLFPLNRLQTLIKGR